MNENFILILHIFSFFKKIVSQIKAKNILKKNFLTSFVHGIRHSSSRKKSSQFLNFTKIFDFL